MTYSHFLVNKGKKLWASFTEKTDKENRV